MGKICVSVKIGSKAKIADANDLCKQQNRRT